MDDEELKVPLYNRSDEEIEEEASTNSLSKFFSSKGTIQGYKDAIFLVLFAFSLLVVCAIAITYGTVSLVNPGAEYWIIGSDGSETEDKAKEDIVSKIMLGLMFVLSLSTVLSLAWVYLLSYIAIFMVNAIIICLVVLSVVGAIVVLSLGYPSFGFLLLTMALTTLLVSLFFQSRIEFASINLDIACKAVVSMPSTIGYSLLMLLFQATYVLIWCVAAIGFATNDYKVSKFFKGEEYTLDQCSSYSYASSFVVDGVSLTCSNGSCHACLCDGVLVSNSPCFTPRFYWSSMFGLLFALIWTNSIMVNIVHCTVVAAVARWWTTGTCTVEALQYFFSTFTSTSLGSICFGSLLGAIVRTMRAVTGFLHARVKRSNDNSILGKLNRWAARVLDYLLTALDRIIVYFNRYAFCYVAIEEYDYIRASYAATTLFRARGFTALLNDDLLDFVIYISNTLIACVTMIAAYIFAKVVKLPQVYMYLLVFFGFFCGYVMGAVVLSTISSAVTAVYVCFARDPAAFQAAHPHLYTSIATAWGKIFPGSQLLQGNLATDAESGPSTGKKVQFSTSTTIHGSYGNSNEKKNNSSVNSDSTEGRKPINLRQRELGNNSHSSTGFWSSSLVQMVQQNLATATTVATTAIASATTAASAPESAAHKQRQVYTRVDNSEENQYDDNDEDVTAAAGARPGQPTSVGTHFWGTASTMATIMTNELLSKNPFQYSSNDNKNRHDDPITKTADSGLSDTPATNFWGPSQATPSYNNPFSTPATGLHGGYGDYHLGYTESVNQANGRPTGSNDEEGGDLQPYIGL